MRDTCPAVRIPPARQRLQPQGHIRRGIPLTQRVTLLQQRGQIRGQGGLLRRPVPPASSRQASGVRQAAPCAGRAVSAHRRPSPPRSRQQRAGRAASAPAAGASGKGRASGAVPQARQSSTSPLSSASAISGRSNGARPRCSAGDHSRIATPGASRPARPARWSAAARLMRTVASRVRPVAASSLGARRHPPSTTMRTPGTVREVSAILVASTTRRPSAGRNARSCSAGGKVAVQRQHQRTASLPRPDCMRRISPMPGRNAKMSPAMGGQRVTDRPRHAAPGKSRGEARSRFACSTATGNMPARRFPPRARPSGQIAARHPRWPTWQAAATPAGVAVAESRHSARARSAANARSWISSRITRSDPVQPGVGQQAAAPAAPQ